MGWFSGEKAKVETISTMNAQQKRVFPVLLSALLGGKIPASILADKKAFNRLLRSGELDTLLEDKNVYQGERVAPLTGTQQKILGSTGGYADLVNAGSQSSPGFGELFERRGLPAPVGNAAVNPLVLTEATVPDTGEAIPTQVVGETPEVITAKEDVAITPSLLSGYKDLVAEKQALYRSQLDKRLAGWEKRRLKREARANPLATEGNQQGIDPATLLQTTQLPGLQTGGILRQGQSAVVGERGRETVNPLRQQTQAATGRALSGRPSATVNTAATEGFIQGAIANPLRKNFQENTLQQTKRSFAGPGYWGSARAKAEVKGAQDVESQIGSLGAQYRYADEQARRELSESAANRSLAAIPSSLNVQNNPLAQGQMQANIGATEMGTARTGALLPGEVSQQLANVGLTNTQTDRVGGLIVQDFETTGRISAETERVMADVGIAQVTIDSIKASTTLKDASLLAAEQNYRMGEQKILGERINQMNQLLAQAGVEQAQNQNEINAVLMKYYEENPAFREILNNIFNILGIQTQTAVGLPGTEGAAGSLIGAGGEVGAAWIASDIRLKKNIKRVPSFFDALGLSGCIWEWNEEAAKLGLTGQSFGLIAQEVEKIIPEAVVEAEDGYKKIKYSVIWKEY